MWEGDVLTDTRLCFLLNSRQITRLEELEKEEGGAGAGGPSSGM